MILDEIASLLEINGLGILGSSLYLGALPDKPDDAVGCYEYGGEAPLHTKDRRAPVQELPRIQVITRSKSYQSAREKAEEVYRILSGFSGEAGGGYYGRITALQSPFFLLWDAGGRANIACNYRVRKTLSPIA